MPQKISSYIERYCVRPQSFIFQYTNDSVAQPGCSILDAAFKRYFQLIFPDLSKDPGRIHFKIKMKKMSLYQHFHRYLPKEFYRL